MSSNDLLESMEVMCEANSHLITQNSKLCCNPSKKNINIDRNDINYKIKSISKLINIKNQIKY